MTSSTYKSLFVAMAALAAVLWSSTAAFADDASNHPDLRGTWMRASTHDAADFILGVDLPYRPQAQNIAADHLQLFKEGRSAASAHLTCRPTGVQGVSATKSVMLILQSPKEIVMVFQEDREVRHIYMNQPQPKNVVPTYSGHSVGHWEGNTLVVDTVGYNGKGQLDEMGNPQSNQLHVVERWTPSADGNTLTVQFTFTDPVYYTRPFTKTRVYRRAPGQRVGDYDCAENPRSDDFANLTFEHDWFKPVCVRQVKDGVAADKVVCKPHPSDAKP
jgi:hypothetical protein